MAVDRFGQPIITPDRGGGTDQFGQPQIRPGYQSRTPFADSFRQRYTSMRPGSGGRLSNDFGVMPHPTGQMRSIGSGHLGDMWRSPTMPVDSSFNQPIGGGQRYPGSGPAQVDGAFMQPIGGGTDRLGQPQIQPNPGRWNYASPQRGMTSLLQQLLGRNGGRF